jgi:hypothetical protein
MNISKKRVMDSLEYITSVQASDEYQSWYAEHEDALLSEYSYLDEENRPSYWLYCLLEFTDSLEGYEDADCRDCGFSPGE